MPNVILINPFEVPNRERSGSPENVGEGGGVHEVEQLLDDVSPPEAG